MPQGYGSNVFDVIKEESVKQICPKEFEEFISSIKENNDEIETLASLFFRGESLSDEISKESVISWNKLQKAFNKKTKLKLNIGYHNSEDDGSCYDDIDGVFYWVEGMYQLTPAGKKIGDKVSREFFVSYG